MVRWLLVNDVEIKKRDRWTCKGCKTKFTDLVVYQYGNVPANVDHYITLCRDCLNELFTHTSMIDWAQSAQLCKQWVRDNKIVLLGDCHGNFTALDEVLTKESPFDFFISVGDLGYSDDWSLLRKWAPRGYYVRGNHDDSYNEGLFPLGIVQEINGLTVAGLNGIIKTRNFMRGTADNISFGEVLYLSHLKDVDVLVTHQAPTGLYPSIGEPVLEELLNYVSPAIYISGHVHQYKVKFHGRTFVMSLPMINKGYVVAYFQGKDLRDLEVNIKHGRQMLKV